MSTAPLPVVFISDAAFVRPLIVALRSLFASARRPADYRIYIIEDVRGGSARSRIESAVNGCEITFIDGTAALEGLREKGMRSLLGCSTPHLKFLIPHLLAEPRCLYLDSDIVVDIDAAACLATVPDLQARQLGAVLQGEARHALDHALYQHAGMADDEPVFNSGVLHMNLARMRAAGAPAACIELSIQVAHLARTADQGVLNAYFLPQGEVVNLPSAMNMLCFPSAPACAAPGIVHFVGSPKPFDPLGNLFNRSASRWRRHARGTFRGADLPSMARRAIQIRRSYARELKRKLRP